MLDQTTCKTTPALVVIGAGTLANGNHFYLTPSASELGRTHVVTQLPTRLTCDCKSLQYRGRCAHVAAVIEYKRQIELAQANAEAVVGEDLISRDPLAQTAADNRLTKKTPAHGRWFGGQSQEPFSFMR